MLTCTMRENIAKKICFRLGFFKRGAGGWSCSNPNIFRTFLVLFKFGHFSGRGGWGLPNSKLVEELFCLGLDVFQEGGEGGCLIPKLFRNFYASVWKIFRKRGLGLPDSKDDEEHFCLGLDISQVEFGRMTKVQKL